MDHPTQGGARCTNQMRPAPINYSNQSGVLVFVTSKAKKSPSSMGQSHTSPLSLMAPANLPHPEKASIAEQPFNFAWACALRIRLDTT